MVDDPEPKWETVQADLRRLVGNTLRSLRGRKNLTLEQLAELTMISSVESRKGQISQWESGIHMPSPKNLALLLTALEVSAEEFAVELGKQSPVPGLGSPRLTSQRGGEVAEPRGPLGERFVYLVQSFPRDRAIAFEAGPPEQVLGALSKNLDKLDGWD